MSTHPHVPRLGLHVQLPAHPATSERAQFVRTIDQVVLGERLGFDSVWPVEQHFDREASMLSAPLLFLAAVAARTRSMRLGTAILIAPLHQPLRLAAELATLDVLSGGRVECGLGRGIDPTHFARLGVAMPPGHDALDRTVDTLRAAWTDPGSEVTPSPVQFPHPPLRIAANTIDTFVHAGRRGLPVLVATHINPPAVLAEMLATYRAVRHEHGHADSPDDVTVLTPIVTAADPDRIRALAEPGIERIAAGIRRRLQRVLDSLDPDATAERARIEQLGQRLAGFGYDLLADQGMAVFGTPDQAVQRISQLAADLGAGSGDLLVRPGRPDPPRRRRRLDARRRRGRRSAPATTVDAPRPRPPAAGPAGLAHRPADVSGGVGRQGCERTTRPAKAPVCSPWSMKTSPLTIV